MGSIPIHLHIVPSSRKSIPNWSQLRSTPIIFRPSRKTSISFSNYQISTCVCREEARAWRGRSWLTVSQIEELSGGCEHLSGQLLRRWGRTAQHGTTRRPLRRRKRTASLAGRCIIEVQVLHYVMWDGVEGISVSGKKSIECFKIKREHRMRASPHCCSSARNT